MSWWRMQGVPCAGVLLVLCAACAEPAPSRSDPAAEQPEQTAAVAPSEYGFLLLTDRGDTVAIERVRRGATWLDAHRWLPRSGERSRHVLQYDVHGDLARWDVTRQRGPRSDRSREPEGWRVYVTAESLFVAQGAAIGSRVSLRAVAAPRATSPWHDASGALLEALVPPARGASMSRTDSETHVAAVQESDTVHTVRMEPLRGDSMRLRHPDGEWHLAFNRDGALLGGVNHRARLRLLRVPCPPESLFTAFPPPGSVSDSARYIAEEVVLRASDGVPLAGTFTRPRGALSAPAVLLVSGAGPQDRNLSVPGLSDYRLFAALADTLAQRGIAVLRLDDRGTGQSGGVAYSATEFEEMNDVRIALAWLRSRTDVYADRIALVGHSDGGLTVLRAAEAEVGANAATDTATDAAEGRVAGRDVPHTMRAVVGIGAPSRSGRDIARLQRRLFVAADSVRYPPAQREATLAQLDAATERVARVDPWLRSWLDHDPRSVVWRSTVPVLLVHGERDQQVPVAQAAELAALLRRGARDVRTVRVPAVNHLLVTDDSGDPRRYRALPSRAVSARALGPIVEWLVMRLE